MVQSLGSDNKGSGSFAGH